MQLSFCRRVYVSLAKGLGLKKLFYYLFVNNKIIDILSSRVLSMVVPPIVGLYYGTLDIWGDDWDIVTKYKSQHEFTFTILAGMTLLILFVKGVSETFKDIVSDRYEALLESLIVFFNSLVKRKRDRYFQKASNLRPNADAFKIFTQPSDQLEFVLDGTKRFLVDGLGLTSKQVGVTIIEGKEDEQRWWYAFKCDSQKQHTRARDLMTGDSAAKYALEQGDSVFIPDIRKGVKEGVFFPSQRSKKGKIGSVFCKPVRVNVNNEDYVYIFTIAVYGQFLCTPYDESVCKACERILDEIADRVELELYLHSMTQYKENKGKAA